MTDDRAEEMIPTQHFLSDIQSSGVSRQRQLWIPRRHASSTETAEWLEKNGGEWRYIPTVSPG